MSDLMIHSRWSEDAHELGRAFDVENYLPNNLEAICAVIKVSARQTLGPDKIYEIRAKPVGYRTDFGRGEIDNHHAVAWYYAEDGEGKPVLAQEPLFGPQMDPLPMLDPPMGCYLLARLKT